MKFISKMSSMPIAIFDSGFGGLTVLKRLLAILPYENYIYLGDNINIPYGDKTEEEIIELTLKMADFLVNKKCKMLIIACNTISACSYNILKEKYKIPVMEVIYNGVIDALNNTKNNNISVMGTEFTVKSNAYKNKINEYREGVKVTQLACKKLCTMIENDWNSYDNRLEVLNDYLKNIDINSDTLILACTHYPHITDDIKKILKNNNSIKNIIDPAYHTAISVKQYLEKNNLINKNNENEFINIYTTEDIKKASKFINIFMPKNEKYKLQQVEL
ncbi:glutamate racemase [Brachyspira sp.]|uniref:glutamate racemase n=1 Tax=Brachyspira sp. TaxID=1977261 RepID=UPI002628FB27|nr:glutamate racemase [Brachyspira sp.]